MLGVISFADVGKVAGAAPGHAHVQQLPGEPALSHNRVAGVHRDALGTVCRRRITQLNGRLKVGPGEYDARTRFPPHRKKGAVTPTDASDVEQGSIPDESRRRCQRSCGRFRGR
jgi:hypothetical protein